MKLFRVICTAALILPVAAAVSQQAVADDRYVHVMPSAGKAASRGDVQPQIPVTHGLAAVAGQYRGRNPTGMRRQWCGAFVRHVVRQSGYPDNPNGNLSRSWASYGRPAAPGAIGAIAVMRGHVGIVTGRCEGGYQVISGNFNGTTDYGCYPARRITAWRHPG